MRRIHSINITAIIIKFTKQQTATLAKNLHSIHGQKWCTAHRNKDNGDNDDDIDKCPFCTANKTTTTKITVYMLMA